MKTSAIQKEKDILRSNLKLLLSFIKWNQQDLAKELELSRQMVNAIICGRNTLTTVEYFAIRYVLLRRAEELSIPKEDLEVFFVIPNLLEAFYRKGIRDLLEGS